MYLMAYKLYHQLPSSSRETWLRTHGLVASRFKQFVSSADNIREQVRTFMSGCCNKSSLESAPKTVRVQQLTDWQLNALRLLLVWTCDNNFLQMCEVNESKSSNSIDILSPELNEVFLYTNFSLII